MIALAVMRRVLRLGASMITSVICFPSYLQVGYSMVFAPSALDLPYCTDLEEWSYLA